MSDPCVWCGRPAEGHGVRYAAMAGDHQWAEYANHFDADPTPAAREGHWSRQMAWPDVPALAVEREDAGPAPSEAPPEPDTSTVLLQPAESMIPGPDGPVHVVHCGDLRTVFRRIWNATRKDRT